jgi:hypothetical protein
MFLKSQLLNNTFAVLLYKALHVPHIITLIKPVAAPTLKITVAFIVAGIHVLSVNEMPTVGFFPMYQLATADATAEAVSIAVAQSYVK